MLKTAGRVSYKKSAYNVFTSYWKAVRVWSTLLPTHCPCVWLSVRSLILLLDGLPAAELPSHRCMTNYAYEITTQCFTCHMFEDCRLMAEDVHA